MSTSYSSSVDVAEVAEQLRRTKLFANASAQALDDIAATAVRLVFRPRQVIVSEHEPGDRMYIVLEGNARVYVTATGGKQVTLAMLEPGDSFGELSLVDGQPRSASVEAASDPTVVVGINRSKLLSQLRRDPSLVEALLVTLSVTVRRVTGQTADVAFFDAHQRAARYLLAMCSEHDLTSDALEFDLGKVKHDLAEALGRSDEQINQILTSFQYLGGVQVDADKLIIREPDLLRQQVETDNGWSALASSSLLDPLTKIANRRLFDDRLVAAFSRASRINKQVAVLILDIDNFKSINDTYGHAIGDLVLQTTAERLQACIRRYDTSARLGGDEFALLLEDIKDAADVETVAQRVGALLKMPLQTQRLQIDYDASLGVAISTPGTTQSPDELVKEADDKMYAIKRQRKAEAAGSAS